MAVSDRDVSGLAGCIGAPAMTAAGVFGIVSQCEKERCAIVLLLSMARSFIKRTVPQPASLLSGAWNPEPTGSSW
jgi:hypothetical protein